MPKMLALKNLRWLCLGLLLGGVLNPAAAAAKPRSFVSPVIRIAILKNTPEAILKIKYPFTLLDPQTGILLSQGPRLPTVVIKGVENGLKIGDKFYPVKRVRFSSGREITVRVRGQDRRYRGEIDVSVDSSGEMWVINRLDVEEYIKGVLFHEASHRWPMETLKVQAVASRTYAYYQMQMNKSKGYDLTNDIYSQVYGGRNSEKFRTNIAVDKTRGEILFWDGKILPAYFHATCAGMTENVRELWNNDLPPLAGVRCPFCVRSPHFHWKRNFRSKDIQDKLNARGYNIGLIKEIRVTERNPSGRIRQLSIFTRDGQTVTVTGKDFREILGPNLVRSNNYEVVMKGYYFDLVGSGWGHGVGMCQWGAFEMGLQQYRYDEILEFYYPGAQLHDLTVRN